MRLLSDYDALERRGRLDTVIPDHIRDNLSPKITLRPYQVSPVARFREYLDDPERVIPVQLLFEMATGSGKTVVMAALILDLYTRGYRNFLFFVNSSQIVEKTRANFVDPGSSKHLFAREVRIRDRIVPVRSVSNFDESAPGAINIHFTTIQGLHARMLRPRENDMTPEDFADKPVVLISDEAHHMSAETRAMDRLTEVEREARLSWEGTVRKIMEMNSENVLLEFTATGDLENPVIQGKYEDRLIYRYDLRRFREDRYSKDIELRQADLSPQDRMLQAVILSQYRRRVAEGHGIRCKPVILMKSRVIKESNANEAAFHDLIRALDGEKISRLQAASVGDETLGGAFRFILGDQGMDPGDFARELRTDFAPERIVNVNDPKDLESRQILLNSLEEPDNEIRVIFAVDKLNEGWDVLNLFDIVRLYDTRDGKGEKVGKTTMSEAQLIGRGARYFPFTMPGDPDLPRDRRKLDGDIDHPLRVIEQLHYHCTRNPRYIDDIKRALRNTGMIDETARRVNLRVKPDFRGTEIFRRGHIWHNERIPNPREDIGGLVDYMPDMSLSYPPILSGRVSETGAFEEGVRTDTGAGDQITRTLRVGDLGYDLVRFAMDGVPLFRFRELRDLFPRLTSRREFVESPDFLGGVGVTVRGVRERVENPSAGDRLDIARFILHRAEGAIRSRRVDHVGSRRFVPRMLSEALTDRSLKIGIEGESGRSWSETLLEGMDHIDLHAEDWHVFEDSYGTDQEKHLIRFIHDNRERLRERFPEFYLIRNEKMITIYSFEEGRPFEPDFLLLLRRPGDPATTTLQVFIEPKMQKLIREEEWKERFLGQLRDRHELVTLFPGREYRILGLPFFNTAAAPMGSFQEGFEGLFE